MLSTTENYCTAENPSGHFEETRVQLKLDEVSNMNIYEYISIKED